MKTLSLLALLCLVSCDVPEPPKKALEIKAREIDVEGWGKIWRAVDPETGAIIYLTSRGGISAYPPMR